MPKLSNQNYLQLFLDASDLPSDLRPVQDSRGRGADPQDTWFVECQGEASGMMAWQAPIDSTVQRLVDIRWVFPDETCASNYHQQTLTTNCEGLPQLPQASTLGAECHVFGGKVDFGAGSVTSYMYIFRVGRVVIKLYVAQGEGESLQLNRVTQIAQHILSRVSAILLSPQLSGGLLEVTGPTQPTAPIPSPQQFSQPQQLPPFAPPQQFSQPGYATYAPPQNYNNYPQGQGMPPQMMPNTGMPAPYGNVPNPAPWPNTMPPLDLPQPSSGLAISTVVLGMLAWLVSIPAYVLIIATAANQYIGRDGEEALSVFIGITLLLTIPTLITFYIWLYKTWKAIPAPHRSTTPGKAVGFLFIPVFQYYWIFRAIPGLSNSIQRAHKALNPYSTKGAGYVLGIVGTILLFIPLLQWFAIPLLFIWVLVANSAKNRVLRLYQAQLPKSR